MAAGDSPNVARKAKENVNRSRTEDMIRIRCADFLESDPPPVVGKPILLMNPPYGERIGEGGQKGMKSFFHSLGGSLKINSTDDGVTVEALVPKAATAASI